MTAGGLRASWLAIRPNTRGAIWIFFSGALFACADGIAKTMARDGFDVFEIACLRYLLGLIFVVPVVAAAGWSSLATRRPVLHAARATMVSISQILAYVALSHMYIADVTAINFARPLCVAVLAVLFLGERVDWRRWLATAVGFCGVIVMARPGAGGAPLAALAAVASTALLAAAMVMVSRYADSETALRFVFYYHAGGALLFSVPAIFLWRTPDTLQWALFLALALFSVLAQTCAVRGYAIGEASVIGPVDYLRLIFAALIGYTLFSEAPGPATWLGAAVIVASAVYVARRGRYGRRAAR
jgi:drug/metabolite transporter (DMT)-like permease